MVDADRKLAAATLSTYDLGKWDSPTPQMLQEMSSLSRGFDGTRQHFDQLTQGMPVNALEQFRATNNREMNLQKIAADQSANHIFNIKDKTLFSLLNKSVQDKAEGKSSAPEKQVQEYLENKQKTIDGFLDQKLKSATEDPQKNQKAPGDAEIEKVTVMMRDDADTGTWEKATEGWDANGLNNLRASAGTMMQQNIYSGGQAASLAAQVEDKQMLQLLATAKPASGPDDKGEATQKITQDLDAYARARETQINEWTQAARSKPVTGMTRPAAAPVEASVSAGGNYDRLRSTENRMKEALGRMEESRPLSNVDCKTAMNNSAQGGTTTVTAGGRLNVSPADIRQGAKDILTKPREDWPDLTKWDRRSLETLRGDVRVQTH